MSNGVYTEYVFDPPPPVVEIVIVPAEAVKVIPVLAAKVMPPVNPFTRLTPVTAPVSPLKDETRPVIFVPEPENPTVEDTSPVKFAVTPFSVPENVTPPAADIPEAKFVRAPKVFVLVKVCVSESPANRVVPSGNVMS